jgi:hypothetical protein
MSMRGRHKSLDKHLKNEIAWVERLPGVQKVILGFSEACRHRYPPGHLRFTADVDGGIKMTGYSGKGVIDLFIRIDPLDAREDIKRRIAQRFSLN